MFRLEISLGGDMTLSYCQISEALRCVANGLLDCQPEPGDGGTVVVDGAEVGTWRVE